jgi:hypothetical protein
VQNLPHPNAYAIRHFTCWELLYTGIQPPPLIWLVYWKLNDILHNDDNAKTTNMPKTKMNAHQKQRRKKIPGREELSNVLSLTKTLYSHEFVK